MGPDDTDVDFRRITEEARDEKKGPRYLRPSAQMVRVNSWWWYAMEKAPKEAHYAVAAKLVFLIDWKTAASGPGRAAGCVELV